MDETVPTIKLFGNKQVIDVRGIFLGERIELWTLESTHRLAMAPLMVTAGESGCAALFRYGVVVLFGLEPLEEVSLLSHVKPSVNKPFPEPEIENAIIRFNVTGEEGVESSSGILLSEFSVERLQVVADILAKAVVLDRYEARVTAEFDRIEPLAVSLQQRGTGLSRGKALMRHIGDTLLIQHKMVGRVEVSEKPEILWDHPELERLYARLEDEYELQERHIALERKLELIARTVETQIDLLHNNRSLRVEWYIVILIVVEIVLTLYELFFRT
jgi:uncharacterized Rmd1/YagE family protein